MEKIAEAPPLAADVPDEHEALCCAAQRAVLALLRAARVRGLPLEAAVDRLNRIAEIFEEAEAHGV
jgi:hypothetical protein